MKNLSFFRRLGFALDGIRAVWASEASFRTQIGCAMAAAVFVVVLRPGWLWGALVILASALVLALELMNTAFEYLIDHVHPDIAPAIKRAKDAAAGAVLVASIGALLIGVLMVVAVISGA